MTVAQLIVTLRTPAGATLRLRGDALVFRTVGEGERDVHDPIRLGQAQLGDVVCCGEDVAQVQQIRDPVTSTTWTLLRSVRTPKRWLG